MSESQHCSEDRFAAPGVSSIIFAPPQQNSYVSIVTIGVPLLDAFALECLTGFDESATEATIVGNWLRGTYEHRNSAATHSTEYYQQALNTSSFTLTLSNYAGLTKVPSTAARRFPFMTHLDLLTSPAEGTFFDPDDFVER
jgi:hypothetical protein